MIVIKELKLNKFRNVSIPRNKDLFLRVGLRPLPEIQDGQTASFSNGLLEELDAIEAQFIRENQMPLNEKL